MTKITANLFGSIEEKNPLEPCPVCDELPVLNVKLDRPTKIFFCCPKCGEFSCPASSVTVAYENWNKGKPPAKQSRMEEY